MSTQKKHAKYAASAAHRWLNCAGSIALIAKAPPPVDSKYAAEGTQAHEVFEKAVKMQAIAGYPREMIMHAVDAAKTVAEWAGDAHVHCESKIHLDHINTEAFGTVDVAIIDEFGPLTIVDYKYGAGYAVDPEENPQMLFYALGFAHLYDYNFSSVKLAIIQPRAHHERGPVRKWGTSVKRLLSFGDEVARAIDAAEKPGAEVTAGEWCRFCPAASICPALSTQALTTAQAEFDTVAGAFNLPSPENLSPEVLGKTLTAMEKLEFWIDATRARAFSVLEGGGVVPGYKLVAKRGTRKWNDAEAVEAQAKKRHGNEAFEFSLKSPAQLEKVAGKEWVNARCSSISTGVTMVPDSDNRPAATTAALDFADSPEDKSPVVKTISKRKKKS